MHHNLFIFCEEKRAIQKKCFNIFFENTRVFKDMHKLEFKFSLKNNDEF